MLTPFPTPQRERKHKADSIDVDSWLANSQKTKLKTAEDTFSFDLHCENEGRPDRREVPPLNLGLLKNQPDPEPPRERLSAGGGNKFDTLGLINDFDNALQRFRQKTPPKKLHVIKIDDDIDESKHKADPAPMDISPTLLPNSIPSQPSFGSTPSQPSFGSTSQPSFSGYKPSTDHHHIDVPPKNDLDREHMKLREEKSKRLLQENEVSRSEIRLKTKPEQQSRSPLFPGVGGAGLDIAAGKRRIKHVAKVRSDVENPGVRKGRSPLNYSPSNIHKADPKDFPEKSPATRIEKRKYHGRKSSSSTCQRSSNQDYKMSSAVKEVTPKRLTETHSKSQSPVRDQLKDFLLQRGIKKTLSFDVDTWKSKTDRKDDSKSSHSEQLTRKSIDSSKSYDPPKYGLVTPAAAPTTSLLQVDCTDDSALSVDQINQQSRAAMESKPYQASSPIPRTQPPFDHIGNPPPSPIQRRRTSLEQIPDRTRTSLEQIPDRRRTSLEQIPDRSASQLPEMTPKKTFLADLESPPPGSPIVTVLQCGGPVPSPGKCSLQETAIFLSTSMELYDSYPEATGRRKASPLPPKSEHVPQQRRRDRPEGDQIANFLIAPTKPDIAPLAMEKSPCKRPCSLVPNTSSHIVTSSRNVCVRSLFSSEFIQFQPLDPTIKTEELFTRQPETMFTPIATPVISKLSNADNPSTESGLSATVSPLPEKSSQIVKLTKVYPFVGVEVKKEEEEDEEESTPPGQRSKRRSAIIASQNLVEKVYKVSNISPNPESFCQINNSRINFRVRKLP